MKPVFADTSYYLALANPNDPLHQQAVERGDNLLGRVFTTEFVIVELGSALSRGSDRMVFLELYEHLISDSATTIISDSTLIRQGVALFANRPDKDWSLVDCISFIVMKQERLKEALSADRHFVQAGFVALLR